MYGRQLSLVDTSKREYWRGEKVRHSLFMKKGEEQGFLVALFAKVRNSQL